MIRIKLATDIPGKMLPAQQKIVDSLPKNATYSVAAEGISTTLVVNMPQRFIPFHNAGGKLLPFVLPQALPTKRNEGRDMVTNNQEHELFMASLKKYSELPIAEMHILELLDKKTIEQVDDGIVFVHCYFSEYSVTSLGMLTKALQGSSIPLYVAEGSNTDYCALQTVSELPLSGAWGETFFVRHRQVAKVAANFQSVDDAKRMIAQIFDS